MNVLDLDRRLVDQNPDGQREPAQGHDVDRIAGQIEDNDRPQERQRDVQDNDDHRPEVAQEQQHHESRQAGAQGPFHPHALDGPIDDRRLVELIRDLDVVGHDGLEPRARFSLTAFTTVSVDAEACLTTGR